MKKQQEIFRQLELMYHYRSREYNECECKYQRIMAFREMSKIFRELKSSHAGIKYIQMRLETDNGTGILFGRKEY